MTVQHRSWRDALRASSGIVALNGAGEPIGGTAFVEHVERLATTLASATPRPRIIGLLADNSADWIAIDLATQAAGIPLVPLPAFFTAQQLQHVVDATAMDTLFTIAGEPAQALGFAAAGILDGLRLPWFRRAVSRSAALPAGTQKITFTSGTTGSPKGVCLDDAAQWTVARGLAEATRELAIERHLCLLPLSVLLENVAGVYAPMLRGATCCIPPLSETGLTGASGFDARRCLESIENYRAQSIILLPQMLSALTSACEAGARVPRNLRFAAVGGAKVAPAVIERARSHGWPVYQGYGLSECASVVALNLPGEERAGSVGRPLPHVRVRIAQSGEIEVAGKRFLGYLGDARQSDDEWLCTGDLGRIDDDGFVFVNGRSKHVLITSFGRNVAPEWPEAELLAESTIAQAAVFGDSRPALCALIVPRASTMTDAAIETEIMAANRRLPDYARIAFWIRAEAPFDVRNGFATTNGRPRRGALWRHYGARLDALYANRAAEGCYVVL